MREEGAREWGQGGWEADRLGGIREEAQWQLAWANAWLDKWGGVRGLGGGGGMMHDIGWGTAGRGAQGRGVRGA